MPLLNVSGRVKGEEGLNCRLPLALQNGLFYLAVIQQCREDTGPNNFREMAFTHPRHV